MTENVKRDLWDFIEGYCNNVVAGFEGRWSQVTPEIYNKEKHETIGGLLSRQATLSVELAKAPSTWNGHIAPLILRCMTDAHITLAWVLDDPLTRSKEYVLHGLGQEKLFIEYLEEEVRQNPNAEDIEDIRAMIEVRRAWLNAQRQDWATEVNVGSWSGKSTRTMAQEVGCESLYRFAYVPFSGPAHNMWQHVSVYNMEPCENPLHKWHLVPKIQHAPVHPDFLYRSAKYVSKSYELVDEKLGISCNEPLPTAYFTNHPFMSDSEADDPSS